MPGALPLGGMVAGEGRFRGLRADIVEVQLDGLFVRANVIIVE